MCVFVSLLFPLLIVVCYAQNATMFPIILFCCSLFVVVVVDIVLQSFRFCICIYFFVDARKCAPMWVCVCVCVCKTFLHLFYSILYISAQYVYEFAEKSKTTNRKTSESIRKSYKQCFGVCEWLRGTIHLMCTKHTRTHTHTHRKIYTIRETDM